MADLFDITKLSEPLSIDQIDFRIQSINKGGYATILAYKDARVDRQRLDDVVGALYWKRQHLNNNHNCIISVWNPEIKEWISKEDVGTESYTEAEKGVASDSFKRSGFQWGIGCELYDYPVIQVKLRADEFNVQGDKVKQTWNLKLKEWMWFSQFEEKKIIKLSAVDEKGNARYEWSENPRMAPKVKISKEVKDTVMSQSLAYLESGDEAGLKQVWDEFDSDEKPILWAMFNSEQRDAMKKLMAD